MIGDIRLVEGGKAIRVLGPGKAAAVDDGAAERGAVAAEELGQRVNGDVGAVVERFEQDRRGDRIVDDQRHAVTMRDLGQRFDVADIAGGIADRFGEHRPGVLVDQLFDRVRLVAFGEAAGDALARQHVAEQRVRGAVKLRHRDDVAAAVGEIDESKMQRGLSGRHRERADAAFELGDALFEHRGGRVGDPAVAIAFGLEVEQGGAVIGAVERVSDGLVDRNGDRFGGGSGS